MAYASIAGMPPVTGLYAASLPLIMFALTSSSRRMTHGPTAATAALSAATVAPLVGRNPNHFVIISSALAIGVGVILLLAGIAKLGVIAEFLSGPVLTGFVVGVALTIVLGQLNKILAVEVEAEGFVREVIDLTRGLHETNDASLVMGVAAFVLLIVLHRVVPRLPAALVVVVGAVLVVRVFELQDVTNVIGDIPRGLPGFAIPAISLTELGGIMTGAVGVAIVVCGESMAMAKSFAKPHREKVDANREPIATGAANVTGGLFGAWPTSGSNSRTAAAAAAGQETQVANLIVGALVLLAAALVAPALRNLPEAVLGAIVIHAVLRLIRIKPMRRLWERNRADFAAALATFVGVLSLGVLAGLLVGIFVSIGALMAKAARPRIVRLALDPATDRYREVDDLDREVETAIVDGIAILRFDSELFFANVTALTDAVDAIIEEESPRAFVLDSGALNRIDTTAAEALDGLLGALDEQGIELLFARLKRKPASDLARCGVDVSGRVHVRVSDAVNALRT